MEFNLCSQFSLIVLNLVENCKRIKFRIAITIKIASGRIACIMLIQLQIQLLFCCDRIFDLSFLQIMYLLFFFLFIFYFIFLLVFSSSISVWHL